MTMQQSISKCNPLYKILNLVKSNFPELFLLIALVDLESLKYDLIDLMLDIFMKTMLDFS